MPSCCIRIARFGLGDLFGYEYSPETQRRETLPHRGNRGAGRRVCLRQGTASGRGSEGRAGAWTAVPDYVESQHDEVTRQFFLLEPVPPVPLPAAVQRRMMTFQVVPLPCGRPPIRWKDALLVSWAFYREQSGDRSMCDSHRPPLRRARPPSNRVRRHMLRLPTRYP